MYRNVNGDMTQETLNYEKEIDAIVSELIIKGREKGFTFEEIFYSISSCTDTQILRLRREERKTISEIPSPTKAPSLRTIDEAFSQRADYYPTIPRVDYPYNGNQCKLCGKPVHSTNATQVVCNKCASEYKF